MGRRFDLLVAIQTKAAILWPAWFHYTVQLVHGALQSIHKKPAYVQAGPANVVISLPVDARRRLRGGPLLCTTLALPCYVVTYSRVRAYALTGPALPKEELTIFWGGFVFRSVNL